MIHKLSGEVIHGQQRGRTLWFPTINIAVDQKQYTIESATYRVNVLVWDRLYKWAGTYQPSKWVFETHLLDFSGDLYGQQVTIFVVQQLRSNQQFASLDALRDQIRRDVQTVRDQKLTVMTFGTFDCFHPWHISYLTQGRCYGDRLITIVARDDTVEKVKKKRPVDDQDMRVQHVVDARVDCHIVELGHESDYMYRLKAYRPDVIALGYDQQSFVHLLEDFVRRYEMQTMIVRCESHQPEKYKSSLMG